MSKPACGNCRHWEETGREEVRYGDDVSHPLFGKCAKRPVTFPSHIPRRRDTDWCDQHERKAKQ